MISAEARYNAKCNVAWWTEITRFTASLYQVTHDALTSWVLPICSWWNKIWKMPFNQAKCILHMLLPSRFLTLSNKMMWYNFVDQLHKNIQERLSPLSSCHSPDHACVYNHDFTAHFKYFSEPFSALSSCFVWMNDLRNIVDESHVFRIVNNDWGFKNRRVTSSVELTSIFHLMAVNSWESRHNFYTPFLRIIPFHENHSISFICKRTSFLRNFLSNAMWK